MKHLLLAPFLLGFTSPVKAESVWLIIHKGVGGYNALEKIEMIDMNQCELMGAKWKSSNIPTMGNNNRWMSYTCLKGK